MAYVQILLCVLATLQAASSEARLGDSYFTVLISPWSECRQINESHVCYRTRDASCVRSEDDALAPWYYCEDNGLVRPNDVELCLPDDCVQDCVVTVWSDWTECNCTASRYRSRFRDIVIPPANGGTPCSHLLETSSCECPWTIDTLPRNHTWKLGRWGACVPLTQQCGYGSRNRTVQCIDTQGRTIDDVHCISKAPYANILPPASTELCEVPCPCVLSEWTPWSECTAVCDAAVPFAEERRARPILQSPTLGEACASTGETRPCEFDTSMCPEYVWEESNWSQCALQDGATCGVGLQSRFVYCLEVFGGSVRPVDAEKCIRFVNASYPPTLASCEITCPRDCVVGDWSEWTPCPISCSNASYSNRTRGILVPSIDDGSECLHLVEYKQCPLFPCAQWMTGDFSPCFADSGDCGPGIQSRNIYCADPLGIEINFGTCSNLLQPDRAADCYIPCSNDCVVSDWTSWSECSQTCGGITGVQTRTRNVVAYGSAPCRYETADLTDTRNCSSNILCTDSIYYSEFSAWSACQRATNSSGVTPAVEGAETCALGVQTRAAVCMKDDQVIADYECPIEFQTQETRVCNLPCPNDCILSEWSNFSVCSANCDTGSRMRSRRVIQLPNSAGQACPANVNMEGILIETESCMLPPCTVNYHWSIGEWSQCYVLPTVLSKHSHTSSNCGPGYENRSVSCVNNEGQTILDEYCLEALVQNKPPSVRSCIVPCPDRCVISDWSEFTSCRSEMMLRDREIIPFEGSDNWQANCPELADVVTTETIRCSDIDFSNYGWRITGVWTECLSESPYPTCGTQGYEHRGYACVDMSSAHQQRAVNEEFCRQNENVPFETVRPCSEPCGNNGCEQSDWSPWGACSTTCGPGYQTRTRDCGNIEETTVCYGPPCEFFEYHYAPVSECILTNTSAICGSGTRTRVPICHVNGVEQPDNSRCSHIEMPDLIVRNCNFRCDGRCVVSEWSPWSECPDSCADCTQIRERRVLRAGTNCPQLTQNRPCGESRNNFMWEVRNWTDCIVSAANVAPYCGNGTQQRIVECIDIRTNATIYEERCHNSGEKPVAIQPCTIPCPVDCQVSKFSPWSECPDTCDTSAQQTRERHIIVHPTAGGKMCPSLVQYRPCVLTNCEEFEIEAHESYCSADITHKSVCGSTIRVTPLSCRRNHRYVDLQECVDAVENGLSVQGDSILETLREDMYCSDECPLLSDCTFDEWSPFSDCQLLCYQQSDVNGTSFRSRQLRRAFDESRDECLRMQLEEETCEASQNVSCVDVYWETSEWNADGSREVRCQTSTGIEVSNGCIEAIRPWTINGTCRSDCPNFASCNELTGDCECSAGFEPVSDMCLPTWGCTIDAHCLYPDMECNSFSCACRRGMVLSDGVCVLQPTTDRPTTDRPTTDGPTTERPTTDGPTTEGPSTEGPTTDRPTTDGPTSTIETDTPQPSDVTITATPTMDTTAPPPVTNSTSDSPTTIASPDSQSIGVLPIAMISVLPLVIIIATVIILILITYRCRKHLEEKALQTEQLKRRKLEISRPIPSPSPITGVEGMGQIVGQGDESLSSGVVDDIDNELFKYGMAGRTFTGTPGLDVDGGHFPQALPEQGEMLAAFHGGHAPFHDHVHSHAHNIYSTIPIDPRDPYHHHAHLYPGEEGRGGMMHHEAPIDSSEDTQSDVGGTYERGYVMMVPPHQMMSGAMSGSEESRMSSIGGYSGSHPPPVHHEERVMRGRSPYRHASPTSHFPGRAGHHRDERITAGMDGPLMRAVEALAADGGERSRSPSIQSRGSSKGSARRSSRRRFHSHGQYLSNREPYPHSNEDYHSNSLPRGRDRLETYPGNGYPHPGNSYPYPGNNYPYPSNSYPYPGNHYSYPTHGSPYASHSLPRSHHGTPMNQHRSHHHPATSTPRVRVHTSPTHDYRREYTHSLPEHHLGYPDSPLTPPHLSPRHNHHYQVPPSPLALKSADMYSYTDTPLSSLPQTPRTPRAPHDAPHYYSYDTATSNEATPQIASRFPHPAHIDSSPRPQLATHSNPSPQPPIRSYSATRDEHAHSEPRANYSPQSPVQQASYSPQSPVQQASYTPQSPVQQASYTPQSPAQQASYTPQSPVQQASYSPQLPAQQASYSSQSPAQQASYSPQSPVQRNAYGAIPHGNVKDGRGVDSDYDVLPPRESRNQQAGEGEVAQTRRKLSIQAEQLATTMEQLFQQRELAQRQQQGQLLEGEERQ